MCSMLSGAGGAMMGMTTGMSGPSGMGMGTGGHNFWQARQMSAGSMPHMAYTSGHGHQQHDAKMAEKIVTELQYLMTKTAAMHFGQGRDLHGHQGGPGVGVGGPPNSRETKPHQCQQCLKAFSSNHQLVQHIRVHTGEKPYKCSYCPRRFKQLSHVQQHTRLHTGERPYKCHVLECGRAFIQLSNLQQHLRNHESQLERLKNRPFHCNICGKGFATESSLRTHTGKADCRCPTWGTGSRHGRTQPGEHTTLVGGPNPSCCPLCQKVCLSGEDLMEHMKYVHKDPNASGVPAKRRAANHPCPVCGKFYVNEGSLRKHLACHPEMASQISSSLRMWPCSVCTAVFTHENGLLAHMDQMRMDPKHQFAAQYVLSRAANERREREALLAAAAMNMSHLAMTANVQPLLQQVGSPSGHSDSSTRISTPAELKLERGVRSPLSLAHHHHQQQQQVQQQHHQQQLMDYGLSRMSSNSMLALGGSNHILNNNLATSTTMENGAANRDSLRMASPMNGSSGNNNNSSSEQMLSPTSHQPAAANPAQGNEGVNEVRLETSSPAGVHLDQAEGQTFRSTLPSPSAERLGHDLIHHQAIEQQGAQSVRIDDSTFKQEMSSFHQQGFSEYSTASEILNRYRLEQTIKQLHQNGFQESRNAAGHFGDDSQQPI